MCRPSGAVPSHLGRAGVTSFARNAGQPGRRPGPDSQAGSGISRRELSSCRKVRHTLEVGEKHYMISKEPLASAGAVGRGARAAIAQFRSQ